MQSKKQLLQKDLSFSNELFAKNFIPQNNIKSNNSSQNSLTKNVIPPLVKYNQTELNQKENIQEDKKNTMNQNQHKVIAINPFSRTRNFGNNFNSVTKNELQQDKIPPLSKIQQEILKKYKKQERNLNNNPSQNQQNTFEYKPTKVYLDNTQKLQGNHFASFQVAQKIFNIDSLQESRIANQSIEKQNNWVLDKLQNSSSEFTEGQILLKNMEPLEKQKKIKSKNNSRKNSIQTKKINPLNLVVNSLHSSALPQFIDDDDIRQTQSNLNQQKRLQNLKQLEQNHKSKDQQNIDNQKQSNNISLNKKQQSRFSDTKKNVKKQRKIQDITLQLFDHYISPFFESQQKQPAISNEQFQMQKSSQMNSILINDDQFDNKKFDKFTTKSSPIKQNYANKQLQAEQKHRTISQIIQNQSTYSASKSVFSNNFNAKQHFIHDKTSKQILGSILSDDRKLKMYLKYLQCQIAKQSDQNNILKQNYELLSCALIKIQQISQKNQSVNQPKALAHSIIQLFSSRKTQQSKKNQSIKSFKPQVVRSNNKITIDFDPYLKYQRGILNQRISYLKKLIDQKNKQTQLIKLSYDDIVHNYAESLQSIAKKAQIQQKQKEMNQQLQKPQKQLSVYSKSENKSIYSQKMEGKQFLDINQFNRGSLEGHRFRKATFGKVPSSMRGSGNHDI